MKVPKTFTLEILWRGNTPYSPLDSLVLRASGRCTHSHRANQVNRRHSRRVFVLTAARVSQIYDAVDTSGFFSWVSRRSATLDGDSVQLHVTVGRLSHTVLLVNARHKRFDRLIRAINVQLPKAHHVLYNSLRLS